MHDELADQHGRLRRQEKFTEAEIVARIPAHRPRWRVKPHGFSQNHFGVAQSWNILEYRWTVLQYSVNFVVESAFAFRILREQIPGPRERIGDRFVTSQKDRDDLIAQRLFRSCAM